MHVYLSLNYPISDSVLCLLKLDLEMAYLQISTRVGQTDGQTYSKTNSVFMNLRCPDMDITGAQQGARILCKIYKIINL